MAELIARRRAHRILVVSPAGPLLEQWHREIRERFGLRFETIRSAGELQEIRRSLVLGANPFDHLSYCLTSVDFAGSARSARVTPSRPPVSTPRTSARTSSASSRRAARSPKAGVAA
jgi:hypothetical protein